MLVRNSDHETWRKAIQQCCRARKRCLIAQGTNIVTRAGGRTSPDLVRDVPSRLQKHTSSLYQHLKNYTRPFTNFSKKYIRPYISYQNLQKSVYRSLYQNVENWYRSLYQYLENRYPFRRHIPVSIGFKSLKSWVWNYMTYFFELICFKETWTILQ